MLTEMLYNTPTNKQKKMVNNWTNSAEKQHETKKGEEQLCFKAEVKHTSERMNGRKAKTQGVR
jgi:hypothetical protein